MVAEDADLSAFELNEAPKIGRSVAMSKRDGRQKTETKKAPGRKPGAVKTGRPSLGPTVKMFVKFPIAYMNVIETEARRLQMGRGNFLTMLVQRRCGEVGFERIGGPEFEATDEELANREVYAWLVAPRTRDQIDDLRLGLGGIGVADFFIHLINEWLGTPYGLKRRKSDRAAKGGE